MTNLPTSITRTLERARRRQRPERDDSGLTTLEWLLIVAAVAGIAALAVVLVTNVVSDTSEQITGSSARKTAAQVAAQEIMRNADSSTQPASANTYQKWVQYYSARCDRIAITYADIDDLKVGSSFVLGASVDVTGAPNATNITTYGVTDALVTAAPSAAGVAAHCSVP